MNKDVTHDRGDESIEAKARWFRSLPLSERMEMLCAFTDMALTLNPDLADKKDAQQTERRVQIISAARRPIHCDRMVNSRNSAGTWNKETQNNL